MGKDTKIGWADHTWNPWTGCHKLSEGCRNCYMFRGKRKFQDPNVVVRSSPRTFRAPVRWKEPSFVFVCSWSDFFIQEADEWRQEAWRIMVRDAPWHTYLLLTKRMDRAAEIWQDLTGGSPPPNVWLGVSVENDLQQLRVLKLVSLSPSPVGRFVSFEPLLQDLVRGHWYASWRQLFQYLDWVIVGGESGPGHRDFEVSWAEHILALARVCGIPFWGKQISARWPGRALLIGGREIKERPEVDSARLL